MVLVGDRSAEEGHDAVAHDLVHGAFKAVDRVHHSLEHGVEDPAGHFWVAVGEELHRALQVGEEDRHLLALTFERSTREEDAFGEMLRSVALGGRRRCALRVRRRPHPSDGRTPGKTWLPATSLGHTSRTCAPRALRTPHRSWRRGRCCAGSGGTACQDDSRITASVSLSQKRMSMSRYIVAAVVRCSLSACRLPMRE